LYIYRGEDLPDEDKTVEVNVIDKDLLKLEQAKKKDKKQVFETLFKEDKINEKTSPTQLAKAIRTS